MLYREYIRGMENRKLLCNLRFGLRMGGENHGQEVETKFAWELCIHYEEIVRSVQRLHFFVCQASESS